MRAAFILISVLVFTLACSSVGTQLAEKPLMFDNQIEEELQRVKKINQTLDVSKIDFEAYPKTVGIDARNAKVVLEQFLCWENCPENGEIYLIYEDVNSKQDCVIAGGRVLVSPLTPSPGEYVGCQLARGLVAAG